MNAPTELPALPLIGAAFAGGICAGALEYGGSRFALILAPAEHRVIEGPWNESYAEVADALSFCDGRANTKAMADAGSELAKAALAKRIGDREDWYIPALDELEVIYRNLKPTADENAVYGRNGINLHSCPPALPYTARAPAQTTVEAFRDGGAEAIEERWYWSSTQDAGDSDWAWQQYFGNGNQGNDPKSLSYAALLVRRELIR